MIKSIQRIALLADLSAMDELLLKYIKNMDTQFSFTQLDIIHWLEVEDLPADIRQVLAADGRSLHEILSEELVELVDAHFGPDNANITILIRTEKSISELIKFIDTSGYDMMLVGKKGYYEGSGILSSKLVRLSITPCLFVPEMARPQIASILAPVDFSKFSEPVVHLSLALSLQTKASVELLHIIKLSMQFFPYIKDTQDIKKSLKRKAEDKLRQLRKKVETVPECKMLYGKDEHISKTIYDYAISEGVDLIVIGRKGSHNDSDFLIGSVAERLIANDKTIPVLVVN
ncbi:uspa domain-containing protein [Nitritalea halalkaliphila LW7]|uniref:Uspa domain-containing protein n=1 Tax=Nitritalea halalkaliphila LW7 TaxID=1189621 RepID=I5BV24_9BACT|nr:universal stress protein [Nitritalea halalkaliphila]EIM73426.1 uspa domain-containing protein [Nitritalea halalkaliphila LW7]